VWKRTKLIAKDNNPCQAERLACIRWAWEHLQLWEVLVFTDPIERVFADAHNKCTWKHVRTHLEELVNDVA
jgi:hypothetical protein